MPISKKDPEIPCWRLPGFDYSRPFYYMVTLKRLPGLLPLSAIVSPGRCEMSGITRAFVHIIRDFHKRHPGLEPIECFTVMPDHLHLLFKLAEAPSNPSIAPRTLNFYVEALSKMLSKAYWKVVTTADSPALQTRLPTSVASSPSPTPIFSTSWHDWIVKSKGQLEAFTQYIRENPARYWLRQTHREYFQRISEIEFLGHKWYGYSNPALLQLPVLTPMRYSRKLPKDGEEWKAAVSQAMRIGPGGAGIGTFLSPCEKACGHALGLAGGQWIVLSPEGFGERWHPGRQYEHACAKGRMLFLSLWTATPRKPTNAELYERCHQMGDIIVKGLQSHPSPYPREAN